jgi:hypothetical protein
MKPAMDALGKFSASVRRPFPSWNRSILTEIYLCHACSCQEILRMEMAGQDARLKASLKRSSTGDAQLLQQVVHRAVIAIDSLGVAVAATGMKDKVKQVLRTKLDITQRRLAELQPLIQQHGVSVLPAAEAAAALRASTPSPAVSPRASTARVSAAQSAFDLLAKASAADKRLRSKAVEPWQQAELRAAVVKQYTAAIAALRSALAAAVSPSDKQSLQEKLQPAEARLAVLEGDDTDVKFSSSDEEEEDGGGGGGDDDNEDEDARELATAARTDSSALRATQQRATAAEAAGERGGGPRSTDTRAQLTHALN